jgi:hypothetical protein
MSEWILAKMFPPARNAFQELAHALAASDRPSYVFAELLDLLDPMSSDEFEEAVAEAPEAELDLYWQNHLAATVEHGAALKGARFPDWTRAIPPLAEPVFGSTLVSVRKHLLLHAPAAFAARNLFIDANLGDRV